MSASPEIRYRTDGAVGILELDRPQKANSYTEQMLDALQEGIQRLDDREEVRVVVLRSSTPGKFCGGADLGEIRSRGIQEGLRMRSMRVFDALDAMTKPTIAAIDGPAIGGGLELALACDLRLATDQSRFALPETGLGILPAAGALYRLPRIIGDTVARKMILFGEELSADEALECGLVSEMVSTEELPHRVDQWAAAAAMKDPLALRLAKEALSLVRAESGARSFTTCAQALLYPGGRASGRSRDR